jgi:hypothetical protein
MALDRVLFPEFDSVAYVASLVSCRYLLRRRFATIRRGCVFFPFVGRGTA